MESPQKQCFDFCCCCRLRRAMRKSRGILRLRRLVNRSEKSFLHLLGNTKSFRLLQAQRRPRGSRNRRDKVSSISKKLRINIQHTCLAKSCSDPFYRSAAPLHAVGIGGISFEISYENDRHGAVRPRCRRTQQDLAVKNLKIRKNLIYEKKIHVSEPRNNP